MDTNAYKQKLIFIWAAAAVAFIMIELAVRMNSPLPEYRNGIEVLMDYQKSKTHRQATKPVTLILGDSCLGNAIDAPLLSQKLGTTVYNLALAGNFTTIGDYKVLKYFLEKNVPVGRVIIFHTTDIWGRRESRRSKNILNRQLKFTSLDASSEDVFRRLALVRQSRPYKTVLFQEGTGILPSYQRLENARMNEQAAQNQTLKYDYLTPLTRKDWYKQPPKQLTNFFVDPHIERWLDAILKLCVEKNIPVDFAIGPWWEKNVPISRDYLDKMDAWLKRKSARSARSVLGLVYEEVPAVPGQWMGDAYDHLSYDGKRWFTDRFAKQYLEYLKKESGR